MLFLWCVSSNQTRLASTRNKNILFIHAWGWYLVPWTYIIIFWLQKSYILFIGHGFGHLGKVDWDKVHSSGKPENSCNQVYLLTHCAIKQIIFMVFQRIECISVLVFNINPLTCTCRNLDYSPTFTWNMHTITTSINSFLSLLSFTYAAADISTRSVAIGSLRSLSHLNSLRRNQMTKSRSYANLSGKKWL